MWISTVAGRLRPLLVFYLVGLVLFSIDRALFLAYNYDARTMGAVQSGDILRCFRVGWFYDSAVLCYTMLPMVVAWALVPRRWFATIRFRIVATLVAAVCFSLILFGCVSDLFFFQNYSDRLNYLAFSYPIYRPEVIDMIWKGYPMGWGMALVVLVGIFCYMLFRRLGWPRRLSLTEPRFARPAIASGLFVLLLIGSQGPPADDDTHTSPSQFSRQHVINRASLNPVFTLGAAVKNELLEQNVTPAEYGFLPDADEAVAVARDAYGRPGDVWLDGPNPLARIHRPSRSAVARPAPNIVFIVMESMASEYSAPLGGEHDWTPELTALAGDGILLERFYAVGTRTSRGLVGVHSGVPDMPGRPLSEQPATRGRFLALPDLLRGHGYQTLFIHGGDLGFNDVKRYLRRHGFDTIIDKDDFSEQARDLRNVHLGLPGRAQFSTFWCVDDQTLFMEALDTLNRARGPFFATVLTLTNHPPYEVPPEAFNHTVRRDYPDLPAEMPPEEVAVRYADWAVGDFFRRARKEPWFDNTIFVLVADHCREQRPIYPVDAANFQIYAAIVGPEALIGPPRRIATVASQADLAPTVIGRLPISVAHSFLGRDLLAPGSSDDEGFALLQQNGVIGFVQGDRLVCISPGEPGPAVTGFHINGRSLDWWNTDDPAESERLEQLRRRGTALFQTAADLIYDGRYHVEANQ